MISPYFAVEKDGTVLHYSLDKRHILPWIEERQLAGVGGYSKVAKVKIHPSHHGFDCPEVNPTLSLPQG